jgi:hypothetical protein
MGNARGTWVVAEAEKFRDHLTTIVGGVGGTLLATLAGSLLPLGISGTLIGLTVGSVISSTGSWWVKRTADRAAARAKAKVDAAKRRGRPLTTDETSMIERISDKAEDRRHPGIPWHTIVISALAGLVVVLGVITLWEKEAGKPVYDIIQGKPGRGLSLTGGGGPRSERPTMNLPPAPTPTFVPTPPVLTPTPTPDVPPTTPSSPPLMPTSAAPSPSPSPTLAPTMGVTPSPGQATIDPSRSPTGFASP